MFRFYVNLPGRNLCLWGNAPLLCHPWLHQVLLLRVVQAVRQQLLVDLREANGEIPVES